MQISSSPIKAIAFAALIVFAACKKESIDSEPPNNTNDKKPKTGFKISASDNVLIFRFEDTSENVISRYWDFGDPGNPDTSTIQKTSHRYSKEGSFEVKLVVVRASGIKDSITQPVTVSIPVPTATISRSTLNDVATISFTANVISGNSTIKEYKWDFGDGQIVTNQSASVSHTYNNTGAYTVILTVTNNYNKTATASVLASPTVIDVIRIKKVQLTHTPKEFYDDGGLEGPLCPDPYFEFYHPGLSFTSSVISEQCVNAGAPCLWDIDPTNYNIFDIHTNNTSDYIYFRFFDSDGLIKNDQIGSTESVTTSTLRLKYPATEINLANADNSLRAKLTVEYILR